MRLRRLLILCLLGLLVSACGKAEYWIPPSSPATAVQALAVAAQSEMSIVELLPALTVPPVEASPAVDAIGSGSAGLAGQTTATPAVKEARPITFPTQAPAVATPTALLPTLTATVEAEAPPEAPTVAPTVDNPPSQPAPTTDVAGVNDAPILYYAQAADTLPVIAVRFGVDPAEIQSAEPVPETAYLTPGQLLIIPRKLANTTSPSKLMPDSEVVYSPSTTDFDIQSFVEQAGGRLSDYQEWLKSTGITSGAEVVQRVAIENSVNPRLLLSLLEYHSGWVYGTPTDQKKIDYPLGHVDPNQKGLYHQLVWAVNQLSVGYYAYREGRMTEIAFPDGVTARLAPDLNAGTAALQYYFAQQYPEQEWLAALDPVNGFYSLHTRMFGDPWWRAEAVEPLFPPGIKQPPLSLPFTRNWTWSFTGGPHGAWERDGAFAALDFAPGSSTTGCGESPAYATAAATGLVVRSGHGMVAIDLDGDGREQTGWVLIYLHLSGNDRIQAGQWLDAGDLVGHPSCEGGISTGTHLHIARKFNGEWIPADGPLPFDLGGWVAHAGDAVYKGTLTRGEQTLTACTCANRDTFITRTDADP